MNYNHLHYFHVVATEGTLARASKRLGISQPTLSAQLKQLESYFGKKLFDRKAGSLRLNASGRKALEITHEMFRLGDRLDALFPDDRPVPVTRLEIGISTSVARSFAVERFIKLFGNREVLTRVRQGDHEFLYHELLTSGLDLFITDNPPDKRFAKETTHRKLSSPEFVIIASQRLAKLLRPGYPDTLHRQPFIHYTSHSSYRFEIDQFLHRIHAEPNVVAEADDVYLIRDAVMADIGIGVVPRSIIDESALKKKVAILGVIDRPFEIHAVYVRKDPTPDVLAALAVLAE